MAQIDKTSLLPNDQDMSDNMYKDAVYVGLPWEASRGFTEESGFEPMTRDGTIRASNKEWSKRCTL